MKYIQLILISFLLTGCAIYSKSWIHSPNIKEGTSHRYNHVHGGVTKNSPANLVEFKAIGKYEIPVFVSAQPLKQKHILGGIGIPIFPIFFLSTINYYEDHPNSLIIRLSIFSADTLTINSDSIRVRFDKQLYEPSSVVYKEKKYFSSGIYDEYLIKGKQKIKFKADSSDLFDARFNGNIHELSFLELRYPIDAFKIDKFQLQVDDIYAKNTPVTFPSINFLKTKQRHFFIGP